MKSAEPKRGNNMNKRARNRLIGITAIMLIAIVAIIATVGLRGGTASNVTVKQATSDKKNIGKRIKVGGVVVTGSWDKKTNPMTFKIRDEADSSGTGTQITVIYSGTAPSTFGDGVTAIVTGEFDANNTIKAGEMITKCPSKYESSTGSYTVKDLKARADTMKNIPVKVSGKVKAGTIVAPGGAVRFTVLNATGGTDEINIAFEGALPNGMKDGSTVVLTGELNDTGAFEATNVALEGAK